MTQPLSLLVATDLSALSRHAALRAAMLAGQMGGTLALLHVLETPALVALRRLLGQAEADLEQRLATQASDTLTELAQQIAREHAVDAPWHLERGPTVAGITNMARQLGADLLVVGASSAALLRHWLLGATADRLLRAIASPILFVRQTPHEPYRTLLIPVDFSSCSALSIARARSLAPQAQIILLHACALPFEGKMRFAGVSDATVMQYRSGARRKATTQLQLLADQAGLSSHQWTSLVTQGDPGQDILQQQVERDADLIVLGKHGAGMTEELLLGSVTQQVLGQAHCDVLVTAC
ncbi:MAG: universal stress protein [Burkholderiaceae bacterium]